MYEEKILKKSTNNRKNNVFNKPMQKKHNNFLTSQNLITNNNSKQLKKIFESDSLNNFKKTVQREIIPEDEEEPVQMKQENRTGMPNNLKSGIENLSGIDMSDVKVHYNSSRPAEVGALAYTQGTDIHVASGQEKHLAHEAWHVVQQAQGRVQPTTQFKDVSINDDPGLEYEADVMGQKALNIG